MAKCHVLIEPPTPKQRKVTRTTNWELCCLCQEDTGAPLQCPVNSLRASTVSGYVSLANHLSEFAELGHLLMNIDTARLNDGDGMEATLVRHNARWHKTCRLKGNQTKLERLVKSKDMKACPSAVTTRSRLTSQRPYASSAMNLLALTLSTELVHMTLMPKFVSMQWNSRTLTCLPSLHLGTWLLWRQSTILSVWLNFTTEQEQL